MIEPFSVNEETVSTPARLRVAPASVRAGELVNTPPLRKFTIPGVWLEVLVDGVQ